jgi:hypothetical protein
MVAEEMAKSIVVSVAQGVAKKIIDKIVEEHAEELSLSKDVVATIIYFTIFRPKASEEDVKEFISNTVSRIGEVKSFEEGPLRNAVYIGKSRFWLLSSITRISDIIFYEALFGELIDAIEGKEKYQETELDEELMRELGIKEDALKEINDVTLTICPDPERVRAEDVHLLVRTLFDEASNLLLSQRIALKIKIFGYRKKRALDAIEERLRRLGVAVFRSEEKPVLTAVPTPSRMLEKELYEAIYGKGRQLLSFAKAFLFSLSCV